MTDDAKPAEEVPDYRHQRWAKHFEEIDHEIGAAAMMCQVPLLDPGVIERVMKGDKLVCGKDNPRAFDKLRQLVTMHYLVRGKAVANLGEAETMKVLGDVVERLRSRFGGKLGGPFA